MDLITNSKALKLRSHLDKYLIANEDNCTVCVSRNCITRRSTWIVEPSAAGTVRLKSYGTELFLAASDRPSPWGVTGKRVVQSAPCDDNKGLIFDWEPIAEGSQIKLKARGARGKFLKANGGPPPWNKSVTHDATGSGATKFWTLWEVVPAVIEEGAPLQAEIDILSPSTSESSFPPSEQSDDDFASGAFPATSPMMTCPWSPRLSMNKSAMDLFSNARAVRLRSHHDKYLTADDDEEGVTQDRNASSRNARWAVELVPSGDGGRPTRLRLKSRYGKYLTASDESFLLGMTGSKVVQSAPRRVDSSVEWEPIREGKRVKLRSRYGDLLRANGGLPPWRNSITHDLPHRTSSQEWVLWAVDVVDILPTPADPPSSNYRLNNQPIKPAPQAQVAHLGSHPDPLPPLQAPPSPKVNAYERQESYGYTPPRSEGRVIYYHIAEEDGKVNEEDGQGYPLTFKGNSVEELTVRLMEDTGIKDIIVCTRSPLNGKLYPLRLHLPPISVSMHVVVVPSSSLAASS